MTWEAQKKPGDTPKPPQPTPRPEPPRDRPLRESPDTDTGKQHPGIEPSEPWPPPGKKNG